jgi:hypothetical protein
MSSTLPVASEHRWPNIQSVLALSSVAAVVVAIDAYFNSQDGYLARPADYDGISYLVEARAPLLLLRSLHLRAGLHELFTSISPLWISVLTTQQLIFGNGTWQAFTGRFWPVALLLILVYWIVSRRATRSLAIAAVAFTALLPLVSAGVRASSWEFLSGQTNYFEHWYLDDLRPDFLTLVLVLWSIAALAEHSSAPRRSAYLGSAAFAAAAVLAKTSTAPVALVAWAMALGLNWLWNRRSQEATRMTVFAAIFLVILLIPWAVFAGGVLTVVTYLKGLTAFRSAYESPGGLLGGLTFFLVRIPNQLGQIEAWAVIAGTAVLTVALLRRRLGRPETMYAAVVVLFYVVFSLPASKSIQIGEWISLSIWIFVWAGAARFAKARWPGPMNRAAPAVLAVVGLYTLFVYALGAFALISWPLSEQRSNAQLSAVTADVARELGRHVSADQCFAYVPGPGWPASLIYVLMDSNGNAPATTAIDVDPTKTTVGDYVAAATRCAAVLAYREDIASVAPVFFAPAVRQPYLRAVAQWVRSPESGFALDRTWRLTDLAPSAPHTLGRYQGVSLTVDLYLRTLGT